MIVTVVLKKIFLAMMIYSKLIFSRFFHFYSKIFIYYKNCRFDLQLEEWGVDVNVLKEFAITRNFIDWVEDWGKEKHKKYDAVVRAHFVNKYKDFCTVYLCRVKIL